MRDALRSDLARATGGAPWHGPSLADALDGITPDAAEARPVAGAHTVAEIVAHLTVWADVPRRRLAGEIVEPTPAEDWPAPPAWADALARLDAAHAALLAAVDGLAEEDLSCVVARGNGVEDAPYTVADMLRGVAQHVAYHGGQIALLRKATG